jgi:hypothetical protein
MSTKIEGYKALLTRITVAQNVEFHKGTETQVAVIAPRISGIEIAFNEYKEDTFSLDAAFNKKNKSIETNELATKDERRDGTTLLLLGSIDYHFRFPENDAEADTARILKFVADTYKDAPHKDYVAETSYLRNLVTDLRKHQPYLAQFGLTLLVDRLEKENNEFETLHLTRANAVEAKREIGTLTDISAKTNKSFDVFCRIVNGLSLMPLEAATKADLDEIIRIINAQIHQYSVIYHRHAGVISSQKKANGETETTE